MRGTGTDMLVAVAKVLPFFGFLAEGGSWAAVEGSAAVVTAEGWYSIEAQDRRSLFLRRLAAAGRVQKDQMVKEFY